MIKALMSALYSGSTFNEIETYYALTWPYFTFSLRQSRVDIKGPYVGDYTSLTLELGEYILKRW